ncbi:CBS domain-containing protein, partial [Acinetobacter indicus]|uniref:CBS domain-containing protein n=1 Tax=Acinetobacter indicus TaxID=756892 RepID=UPI001443BE5D
SLQTTPILHLRSRPSSFSPAADLRLPRHHLRRAIRPLAAIPRPDIDDNAEGIISGEWPDNFSYLSYDDLRVYIETQILTDDKVKRTALLGEVMSAPVRAVTRNQRLEEIDHHFEMVSGLPVVDGELRCIGVISRKDTARAANGLQSRVEEVMSSPAITLPPNKTVLDAAALMLKEK